MIITSFIFHKRLYKGGNKVRKIAFSFTSSITSRRVQILKLEFYDLDAINHNGGYSKNEWG